MGRAGQVDLGHRAFPGQQSRIPSYSQRKAWFGGSESSSILQEYKTPTIVAKNESLCSSWYLKRHTLKTRSVSFPPCNSFLNVGLFFPRKFWSIGSRVFMVVDNALALTTQTSMRPRHMPALKNDVCDDTRLARLMPAIGSRGSSASRGNVMTARSVGVITTELHKPTTKMSHAHLIEQRGVDSPRECPLVSLRGAEAS